MRFTDRLSGHLQRAQHGRHLTDAVADLSQPVDDVAVVGTLRRRRVHTNQMGIGEGRGEEGRTTGQAPDSETRC